ncbi:MAG: adenosylcobinamide-GDP ribazoletransferase [Clostridium sp.]|nr:adenosylcobinamide-GDP ribazoletransferase [Lachnoclostridium sp.]MCM1253350.1 adenosylcobinamide-GDP ribazoletransferase [Clostridium sp.]
MRVIKSFLIAVSMYSTIPVPQFAWKEEDMRYIFCFFPWIGALIGAGIYLGNYLCDRYHIGVLCRVAMDALIPLLVTGGIHMDGFMDTMDAIHSYRDRERKLEIMKDSHTGAFAVIMLAVYGLIYAGAFSEIERQASLKIVCSGFFLSRCLCGISAISFPTAKKDGTLYLFADSSGKNIVKVILYMESAVCIGLMLFFSVSAGLFTAAAAFVMFGYYYYRARKEFGGVTGDTSGCFILICEVFMIAAAALSDIWIRAAGGV